MCSSDLICPKGWKLPTSGRNALEGAMGYGLPFDRENSFYRLLLAYGYSDTSKNGNNGVGGWSLNGSFGYTVNLTTMLNEAHQDLALSPIYLTRAGNIDLTTGSVRVMGSNSFSGSSTVPTNTLETYHLDFYSANIYPARSHDRPNGFSARCMVK